jgi:hypothetical protein
MELSIPPELLPQTRPRGLHGGHHHRIFSQDHGGFSPTISLLNPVEVPVVTYVYLFYPPSSDWLRPPTQQMAWGLMSRSSIPDTTSHRLQPKILDTAGSLQRQMTGEPYTPYWIKPHHSKLKRRGHQPKKNKSRE